MDRNQRASNRVFSLQSLNAYTTIVMALILANIGVLYTSLTRVREHNYWVSHTNQVLSELELVLSSMKDTETGLRGFLMTGEASYFQPFEAGRVAALAHLRQVKDLTLDNAQQQNRIEPLQNRIAALIQLQSGAADAARKVDKGQALHSESALSLIRQRKEAMDEIRLMVQDMKDTETRLLKERTEAANEARNRLDLSLLAVTVVSVLLVLLSRYYIRRSLLLQLAEARRLHSENWLKTGMAELGQMLRGKDSMEDVGRSALDFFAAYLGMQIGAFYVLRHGNLQLISTFAREGNTEDTPQTVALSNSLLGEAVKQNRVMQISDVPDTYVKVSSALGGARPRRVVILPLIIEGDYRVGAVELGFLNELPEQTEILLEDIRTNLGVALSSALSRHVQQELLEETQRQAEELSAQQEELRASNEELESQTMALRTSQERLQVQQEELRQTNEELEQQAREVEVQQQALEQQNTELSAAKALLENKAQELEQASKYKSEFLANMSHELRTPLNSLLLLATLLAENKEKTLTDKQVDFAQTIFKSGRDLLALINDILDLSKVEAGKLDLVREQVDLGDLTENLERDFRMTAQEKGLSFEVLRTEASPAQVWTDSQRLLQILKNLISNAIKFTPTGSVRVTMEKGTGPLPLQFSVRDTGIGIPENKQAIIFEAFKQSDGSINRNYGGTGLGLTISRELANLLGGHITVQSKPGAGSTFTLNLPEDMPTENVVERSASRVRRVPIPEAAPIRSAAMPEHKEQPFKEPEELAHLKPDDRLILVVEDDVVFGRILADLAHEAGFKTTLATTGEAAMQIAKRYRPAAMLLDIKLPDMSGLSVLERLKSDAATRHVPIHVVSGSDYAQNALALGAIGYLHKPAQQSDIKAIFNRIETTLAKKVKRVLIVEDDKIQRQATKDLLGSGDIEVVEATSGAEARRLMWNESFDCVVLDLRLPDISGFELLEAMEQDLVGPKPPIVVYTAKDLTREEQNRLERYAESIIIKGARSPERLIDEVSLFLHRLESSLPPKSQTLLQKLRNDAVGLKGRRILLVDDDMRNVYALVSALETNGMKVVVARNGRDSLGQLEKDEGIELVLMDIMMPEMDGYEAMEIIRQNPRFKKLPIIALTAKAMKGDLEQCLAAGANDYLPKPINLERLLSLLKVWLPQKI